MLESDEFNFDIGGDEDIASQVLEPEIVEGAGLPAVQAFDTHPALVKLLEFEAAVNELVTDGKQITIIRDAPTDTKAITIASRMKKIFNRLEVIRHHFVDPHFAYKKAVDNFFKRYTDPLEAGEKELGRKSGAFRLLMEQERRRKEAEQAAEARRLQEQLDKQAAESEAQGEPFQAVTVVTPVLPEVPRVTRTEEGSASQRHDWDFEIEDYLKLPREFLVPDEKAIRRAVRAGRREIPGCRIFEKMTTHIRV